MKKYIDTGKIDTRSGFGAGLVEAGKMNPNVVAMTADLKPSLKMAAGLAIAGKVPFAGSFAEFITGRVYDQIRQEVAYGNTNVKLASSHAGVTLGEDGATHQTMEDIALMRTLPNMVVINACDYNQTKQATIAAAKYVGPVYLRFGRPKWPNFTDPAQPFEIGKAYVMNEGKDVSIFACGHLVWEALKAAEALEAEGINADVINVATIKPLDINTVIESVMKTRCAVVAEEHNTCGGLGELIAGTLAARFPAPVEFVNGADRFGQPGSPAELLEAYGLDAAHVIEAARRATARK